MEMAKKESKSACNATPERLNAINSALRHGDKARIARIQGVTRVWVSKVLHNKGVSADVVQAAEQLIKSRAKYS